MYRCYRFKFTWKQALTLHCTLVFVNIIYSCVYHPMYSKLSVFSIKDILVHLEIISSYSYFVRTRDANRKIVISNFTYLLRIIRQQRIILPGWYGITISVQLFLKYRTEVKLLKAKQLLKIYDVDGYNTFSEFKLESHWPDWSVLCQNKLWQIPWLSI